jgi:tetratricopeptide (TPR) repeat protein
MFKAHSLRTLGNHQAAIEACSHQIQTRPQDGSALEWRAFSLRQLGEHAKVVEDCTMRIALNQKHPAAYYWRAEALYDLGRVDEAEADINTFLVLEESPSCRAQALRRIAKYQESLAESAAWTKAEPDNPHAWDCRAECHRKLGDHTGAVVDMFHLIRLWPTNPVPVSLCVISLQALDRRDEMTELCIKWVELDPTSTSALSRAVEALQSFGRHGEALSLCKKWLELDPKCPLGNAAHELSLNSREGEVPRDKSKKKKGKSGKGKSGKGKSRSKSPSRGRSKSPSRKSKSPKKKT